MNQDQKKSGQVFRRILAIVIGLLVSVYTGGIVTGLIGEHRRIDMVTLAAVAIALVTITLLWRPEVFARLKILEMSGVRLEMREVKERQEMQERELELIRLVLAVLLPLKERKHMLNLADGRTAEYKGNHEVRTELRRLRSFELVAMRKDKTIGQLTTDLEFDLADYLELTTRGHRWVETIKEIDRVEKAEAQGSGSITLANGSENAGPSKRKTTPI